MFKITIRETDEKGATSFLYEQDIPDLDVMAVFEVVNKKPKTKRLRCGQGTKKEEAIS